MTAAAGRNLDGIRAVTFDFGNTLVPIDRAGLDRAVAVTAERISARSGPFRPGAFVAAWREERDRQFAEDVPQFREVDIRERIVRVLARLRGRPVPPPGERWDDVAAAALSTPGELDDAIGAYVDAFVEAIPPPPEVEPLLRRLAAGRRLAILSNWPLAATIDRYAEAAGWTRHLHAIVVSQRVGAIKPKAGMFRAAEAALGVGEPAALLHVGDDWVADIGGALEAGWRAAHVSRAVADSPLPAGVRDAAHAADLELERLEDLEAALGPAAAAEAPRGGRPTP